MAAATLKQLQSRFAAHIRDPDNAPAPADIEDRRMAIYRRLFINNVRNFLGSYYPVLRRIYGKRGWAALIREFYTDYRAQTPLFPELPREFLRFLQGARQSLESDPPFLNELAHYEWVRHALSVDEREISDAGPDVAPTPGVDALALVPLLSPLALPLSYNYPVHRIRPDFQPQAPADEATHLLVYRDREDKVRFMQLNVVSAMLLNKLKTNQRASGRELLNEITAEIGHPNPDTVLAHGAQLLDEWQGKGIVVMQNQEPERTSHA